MNTMNFRGAMPRIFCSLVLFCTTLLVAPRTASAVPNTVPLGLNPGDHYRLAFVTSTTRNATSTNIADYNQFVTDAAGSVPALVALGTTWTAIASTDLSGAQENTLTRPGIGPDYSIYNLAGQLVAPTNLVLWNTSAFPLTHAIGIDEGGEVRDTSAWTGTSNDGSPFHPLGGSDAAKGLSIQTNAAWTANQVRAPDELYSLYAMSGVLTAPVPEPGSIFLTGIAVAGLAASSLRQRRCRKPERHVDRDHR